MGSQSRRFGDILENNPNADEITEDFVYPTGMELHYGKWRGVKRVPKDVRDHYVRDRLHRYTDCAFKRESAQEIRMWLDELEIEWVRIRKTGSKYKVTITDDEIDRLRHDV
jgi:hypothetical protein